MGEREKTQSQITELHALLEDAGAVQRRFLEDLLHQHTGCEYLNRLGVDGSTDVTEFKQRVPIIQYDAVEKDIQRILAGDTSNILCCDKTTEFFVRCNLCRFEMPKTEKVSRQEFSAVLAPMLTKIPENECPCTCSSGTSSGKSKYFPTTESATRITFRVLHYMDLAFKMSRFGASDPSGPRLALASVTKQTTSPVGLPVGTSFTSTLKSPLFRQRSRDASSKSCSPDEVIFCEDYKQATYCHLLCGLLRYSEVVGITTGFASAFVSTIDLFKRHWEEICNDIEGGELSSGITDEPTRRAVSKLLVKPNPELANLIRAECSKDWAGILSRLWPNARYVTVTTTGSMAMYVDYLNLLTGGKMHLISPGYASSEGYFAFNAEVESPPAEVAFVMAPDAAFFEFLLPDQESGEEPLKIVDLTAVKEGQEYELVVTTCSGLWRYRMGDTLRCVGFYHNSPKFQFVGRKNVILSVHTDKTEEKELLEVVSMAAKFHLPTDLQLLDFTSYVSLSTLPGHYVIFWAVTSGKTLGASALEECCLYMEAALSEPYRRGRNQGAIAPLELKIVELQSFHHVIQLAVGRDASGAQYKTPRLFKAGSPAINVLESAVLESARSPRPPPHSNLNPASQG